MEKKLWYYGKAMVLWKTNFDIIEKTIVQYREQLNFDIHRKKRCRLTKIKKL